MPLPGIDRLCAPDEARRQWVPAGHPAGTRSALDGETRGAIPRAHTSQAAPPPQESRGNRPSASEGGCIAPRVRGPGPGAPAEGPKPWVPQAPFKPPTVTRAKIRARSTPAAVSHLDRSQQDQAPPTSCLGRTAHRPAAVGVTRLPVAPGLPLPGSDARGCLTGWLSNPATGLRRGRAER